MQILLLKFVLTWLNFVDSVTNILYSSYFSVKLNKASTAGKHVSGARIFTSDKCVYIDTKRTRIIKIQFKKGVGIDLCNKKYGNEKAFRLA